MSLYTTNHVRVMRKLDRLETLLLAVIKQHEPILPTRRAAAGDIIQDATYHRIAAQLRAPRRARRSRRSA